METAAFLDRLQRKEAVIGVVGLGYVGLPLVLTFARKGLRLVGFDIDEEKIRKLRVGESYIRHIAAEPLKALVDNGQLTPTTDFTRVRDCDAVIICVPTPLNKNREPDVSYIVNTARSIAPYLKRGQLVVLESTTYPGTTDELLSKELETPTGLRAGVDYFLAFSPEREDPGNPNFDTQRIPKVVGGLTPACREVAVALYRSALDKVVPVSSTRAAEMAKLLENIFRSVNIALVNEMKLVAERMDIDIWEVIDAAATKPFGFMPFYPGPGLGGHCIPIDPFYLTWKAREYEVATRFIELAGEVNTAMPRHVVDRTAEALNQRKKPLNGSKILMLGIAYKRDIDDVRESPALAIIELLRERGAEVSYHDPYVPATHEMRHHNLDMRSVELSDAALRTADVVLIITDHTSIDYERVVRLAPLVVDTRNATRNVTAGRERIVKA
ncbi:MAG: nucleotide sugar dehydrogenase [Myxococcota bacterium]